MKVVLGLKGGLLVPVVVYLLSLAKLSHCQSKQGGGLSGGQRRHVLLLCQYYYKPPVCEYMVVLLVCTGTKR